MINEIVTGVCGLAFGSLVTYTLFKFRRIEERIDEIEKIIMDMPSADETVDRTIDKILHMKIDMNRVPPELVERMKKQAQEIAQMQQQQQHENMTPPPLKKADSYFG
jgi:hypothetical protein